ncbi:hypothetical protein ACH5RR_032518 [Cinchona calisaya]|uniref:Uncharacterized protein n=1 Tax=Cinchona calisaya TaxID=153742 RepID=A0ABD2YJN5_9GENT
MEKKHLSSIASHVILRCAQELETSVDILIKEFELEWEPTLDGYSRKLVEYCCSKALKNLCSNMHEKVSDGFFSRFTFDMMLAWEMPNSADEESCTECVAKEREDRKVYAKTTPEQDDTALFYSDIMPLLVDNESSSGEEAVVWLATLVPLVADVVNARFTFETLTAATGNQIHFPAYDKFVKEIHKCIKHLQKQATPVGVELADDEFILHVEGTASTQRVVRHIGGTSWPGKLTLTNYALYFEASGVVSYEDALKIDLSKDTNPSVKPTATGPWGAPLFDKAIVYESLQLQEGVVLEFPEITSSTRRDHWLALVKEVMLLHHFLHKFSVESYLEAWEMHARTILGIIRLHAARELLRMSPPIPKNFLIFTLCDELPKGDHVLQELAASLKMLNTGHPCRASTILRSLNTSQPCVPCAAMKETSDRSETFQTENLSSLEGTINQAREEAREIDMAKATVEGLKEEGVSYSAQVLLGLLKPLQSFLPWIQGIFTWEKPAASIVLIGFTLLVIYKEWVGKAIAAFLLWAVAHMFFLRRRRRIQSNYEKLLICTASDKSTMESIVSAQQGLRTVHEVMQQINIAILKLWSILTSRSPKHTNTVMMILSGSAIVLAVIPFKFILIALTIYSFLTTSNVGKYIQSEQGNRRLKEWWESIPVPHVEITDKAPE